MGLIETLKGASSYSGSTLGLMEISNRPRCRDQPASRKELGNLDMG